MCKFKCCNVDFSKPSVWIRLISALVLIISLVLMILGNIFIYAVYPTMPQIYCWSVIVCLTLTIIFLLLGLCGRMDILESEVAQTIDKMFHFLAAELIIIISIIMLTNIIAIGEGTVGEQNSTLGRSLDTDDDIGRSVANEASADGYGDNYVFLMVSAILAFIYGILCAVLAYMLGYRVRNETNETGSRYPSQNLSGDTSQDPSQYPSYDSELCSR